MIEHFLNAVGASQPPERYGESFGAAKGNTAGGLLADSRSLVKGEGLRIATWARPPRLTCGANMEYHCTSVHRVVAKQSARLLLRRKRSLSARETPPTANEPRRGIPHRSWRFPPCRLPGRECTCCAGYSIVKVLKATLTDAFGRRHQGCSGEYNVFPRVVRE